MWRDQSVTAEEDVIAACIAVIQALRGQSVAQLSMSHYELLFYVFLHDGITRNELIDQIPPVSATSMKRYVKELMNEQNLITETESESDFRVKHLHLTEKGYQIIKTIVDKMQDCATCLKSNPERELNTHSDVLKH